MDGRRILMWSMNPVSAGNSQVVIFLRSSPSLHSMRMWYVEGIGTTSRLTSTVFEFNTGNFNLFKEGLLVFSHLLSRFFLDFVVICEKNGKLFSPKNLFNLLPMFRPIGNRHVHTLACDMPVVAGANGVTSRDFLRLMRACVVSKFWKIMPLDMEIPRSYHCIHCFPHALFNILEVGLYFPSIPSSRFIDYVNYVYSLKDHNAKLSPIETRLCGICVQQEAMLPRINYFRKVFFSTRDLIHSALYN